MEQGSTQNGTMRVISDNRFAIIPHWVIFSGITSGALHLYAVLTKYADNTTGQAWPSRTTLANDIGKSRDTVDRHIKELEGIGALRVQRRKRQGTKENAVNLYTVVTANPEVAALMPPPSRVDAAENYTHLSTPSSPNASDLPITAPALPPVGATGAHSIDDRLGISKQAKDYLISEAVKLYEAGDRYWDDEGGWYAFTEDIETITGADVGDLIANKRFDERLAEVIELHRARGPRYGASAWLGTLVNTSRTQPY